MTGGQRRSRSRVVIGEDGFPIYDPSMFTEECGQDEFTLQRVIRETCTRSGRTSRTPTRFSGVDDVPLPTRTPTSALLETQNLAQRQKIETSPVPSARRPLETVVEPNPKKLRVSQQASIAHGPGPPPIPPAEISPVGLVHSILALTDPYLILSTAGEPLSMLSPDVDIRRAYLKLSAKIHPDKLDGMPEANEAFQLLLKAYESAKASNVSLKDPAPKPRPKAKPKAKQPEPISVPERATTRRTPKDTASPAAQMAVESSEVPLFMEVAKEPKVKAKPPPQSTAFALSPEKACPAPPKSGTVLHEDIATAQEAPQQPQGTPGSPSTTNAGPCTGNIPDTAMKQDFSPPRTAGASASPKGATVTLRGVLGCGTAVATPAKLAMPHTERDVQGHATPSAGKGQPTKADSAQSSPPPLEPTPSRSAPAAAVAVHSVPCPVAKGLFKPRKAAPAVTASCAPHPMSAIGRGWCRLGLRKPVVSLHAK
eukprot:GGOE01014162.1.p1 GENE.GGOE01014162.1~~GGOE01014162.1.p1  ORF type:complete len:482 (+),score=37.08 GGOE01014162.1:47-1492(+)